MKEWLKAALYIALFVVGVILFAEWQKSNEANFQANDPAGYERSMEQVREEGIPDPRR